MMPKSRTSNVEEVERVFISKSLSSQQAWESVVSTLHKSDISLFKCDKDRYFGLAIKEARRVSILIWGQNSFIPLHGKTKGLVAEAHFIQNTYRRNFTGKNIPLHRLIARPVPSDETIFTAKSSSFVRTVLKLISKLGFLKKYLKDILVAFKDAGKVSECSKVIPSNSRLVDQHTQFEWALERLKLSSRRSCDQLADLVLSSSASLNESFAKFLLLPNSMIYSDNKELKGSPIDIYTLLTNVKSTFEAYATYLSNSANSWQNLIDSVMPPRGTGDKNQEVDGDVASTVSDEDMTLQTIDCIACVPWNAVCRRTMAVFVRYLAKHYMPKLLSQGFDEKMLRSISQIPLHEGSAITANESKHRFRSILTDRCKWKHDQFMKKAREICLKNVDNLLDENEGVRANTKNKSLPPGEKLNDDGIAPFHSQSLPILLVQVLEALAKDAEDCEAEVRSFCMLVNDATNVTGNVAEATKYEVVPFKLIECFRRKHVKTGNVSELKDIYEEFERYRQMPSQKIDFYSELKIQMAYSRPIKVWFDSLEREQFSDDFRVALRESGITDVLHLNDYEASDFANVKFLRDTKAKSKVLLTESDTEKLYAEHLKFYKLSKAFCNIAMKNILSFKQRLRCEVIESLTEIDRIWTSKPDSSALLPDAMLMNIFLMLQAEYTYADDDTDLLSAYRVGGRWADIVDTLINSPKFPPSAGKHLLHSLPNEFVTSDLSLSRNFDDEELEDDNDIYEDTRYVVLKQHRLQKQQEARMNKDEGKKGYNQGRADFVNAIHNINNGSLYKGRGTALHAAATNGNAEVVEALLEYDADPNIPDGYGRTPLHCSARNGHVASVVSLLNGGANINAKDKNGHTALQLAKKHCKNNEELLGILNNAVKKGNKIRSEKGMARTARQLNDAIDLLQKKHKLSAQGLSKRSNDHTRKSGSKKNV